jgi:antitoxin component YwqK of YwqJK toxin-antitoxin module
MEKLAPGWKLKCLIAPLAFSMLVSCATPGVLADELVEKNGVLYRVDSDEPFTGRSLKYHENGRLMNSTDYRDGKKNGISEWFWENGTLGQRGHLKDGRKDGLLETFGANGDLTGRYNYKNGLRVD